MLVRLLAAALALACLIPVAASAQTPRGKNLSSGWQIRSQSAQPGEPQDAPPEEGTGTPNSPNAPATPAPRPGSYVPAQVPSVFDPIAKRQDYSGTVRRYKIRFRGPRTPRGFRWLLRFEGVRRNAGILLNGKRIGRSKIPYIPFEVEAKGLRPKRMNELVVIVDNRKERAMPEGWWNWGGIIRPVRLIPAGRANMKDLGVMSKVRCRGPATACSARFLVDGNMQKLGGKGVIKPRVEAFFRSPSGRVTRRNVRLRTQGRRNRRVTFSVKVPAPKLWAPENPQMYRAIIKVRLGKTVVQRVSMLTGLRQVSVVNGRLALNNRAIDMRGTSIHEDMPGTGAALTEAGMNRIVADLKAVGANVTRTHYSLNERLLQKLDRAGILVWNEAPIWQRDRLIGRQADRAKAYKQVEGSVIAARNHPSVITHSVANELVHFPDESTTTSLFLRRGAERARKLDPTLPISVAIKTGPRIGPQQTYARHFDIIGLNEYFGWYGRAPDFATLRDYLNYMRTTFPRQALVVTEFGAEARPENATDPVTKKGSYAFQSKFVKEHLDVHDTTPFLSGSLYWTLREFEIFPGWTGGAGARDPRYPTTRHNKGLMTYDGQIKPAWLIARDRFRARPLYRP
jgi:beta-glucuronidase